MPRPNTIARDIVNSQADIIITSSTLALHVVSKANVNTQKYHVFGAVTDPYGTGVGITGKNLEDHPPYLAGIGTFQPVRRAFILAREMNPQLEKVAIVNMVENKPLDDAIQGVEDALRHSGLVSGIDLVIKKYSAQGDIAQLTQILDAAGVPTFTTEPDLVERHATGADGDTLDATGGGPARPNHYDAQRAICGKLSRRPEKKGSNPDLYAAFDRVKKIALFDESVVAMLETQYG